jgi:hypothetical protein
MPETIMGAMKYLGGWVRHSTQVQVKENLQLVKSVKE